MNVTSRVRINTQRIRRLTNASVKALEKTTEALHTEIVQAQVVPYRGGALQGESFFPDYSQVALGRTSLVHSTPYARRMYFHPEYNFSHDENPYAKGKWFEDWMPGGEKDRFARDTFKRFYRLEGGL